MKNTNSLRVRASRFLTDRYAYRERPDYLIELAAFGIIVITVTLSLANAMATTLKWTQPAYLIEGKPISWIERI
jgi:hypothetical protein